MIDLYGIASGVLGCVNPMKQITLKKSFGVIQNNDYSTAPQFEEVQVMADIQAAKTSELNLLENIQQQGEIRSVYLEGAIKAINRPLQVGGDRLVFEGSDWLVTAVDEQWGDSDWCKVLVTRQIPDHQTSA